MYIFSREGVTWSPQKGFSEALKNISKRRKEYQADIKRRMDQLEGISYNLMVLERDSDLKTRIDICDEEYGAVRKDPVYRAIKKADELNRKHESIARRENVWMPVNEMLISWQNQLHARTMTEELYGAFVAEREQVWRTKNLPYQNKIAAKLMSKKAYASHVKERVKRNVSDNSSRETIVAKTARQILDYAIEEAKRKDRINQIHQARRPGYCISAAGFTH